MVWGWVAVLRVLGLVIRVVSCPSLVVRREEESFEGGFEVLLAFGVEAGGGCLEGVLEVVVGLAFVGFEEELVCAGGERECEVAEGVDVGLVGAGFVAADVGVEAALACSKLRHSCEGFGRDVSTRRRRSTRYL